LAANALLKPLVSAFLAANMGHVAATGRIMEALYHDPFKKPMLLLGSERDAMLPHAGLVESRELLAKAGIPVEARFWKGSGHVRLQKDHTEEYRALVRALAKRHLLAGG
jgi:predicted esterase